MAEVLNALGYHDWILQALLILPLAGVIPILMGTPSAAKRIALGVTVAEFVLSLGLWWTFDVLNGGLQFAAAAPWLPAWGISYRVGLDGISLFMVLLSTAMMPLSVLGSWNYITKRERGYYALMLTLLTGMIGVFVAVDLFLFYVFWEVMLIPMYFIIGMWGGQNRIYAAIKFFIYTMAGSLLMLVAILAMVWQVGSATGVLSFDYNHLLAHAGTVGRMGPWLFAAFALAFAIKVPVFPFHTWLPDAHVEAPTAGSVLLAGVLLKMGTYGFLRFGVPFFPDVAMGPLVTGIVIALAVIGIVYGALVALVQPDIKKLVAYSSVSHLGFVMLGIWAATVQSVQGALMVMISHGLSTGALFFMVGMLYERRHTREIAAFGGLARAIPVFSLILTLVALSSIGLPGLNGFVGEFLVLLGSFDAHPWATGIATTGVIFAAAYLLRALQRLIYNPLDKPENEGLADLTPRELAVLLPIVAGILWMGLYPRPILDRMESAAKQYIEYVVPASEAVREARAGVAVDLADPLPGVEP